MVDKYARALRGVVDLLRLRNVVTLVSDTVFRVTRYPVIVSPNLGNPLLLDREVAEVPVVMACLRRVGPRRTRAHLRRPGAFHYRDVHTGEVHTARVARVEPHDVGKYSYLRSLALRNVFGPRDAFYTVYLKPPPHPFSRGTRKKRQGRRGFVLYDLVYVNPNGSSDVNHHALAVYDRAPGEWDDLTFFQFSDLHVAARNDEVFDVVALKAYRGVDPNLPVGRLESFSAERLFSDPRVRQTLQFHSFLGRVNNFNANLRQMIALANREAAKGRLDFVLLTGDLVDYVKVRVLGGRVPENVNNWDTFCRIVTGMDGEQGLEVPAFTVVGNHDFRMNAYRLTGYTSFGVAAEHRAFRLTWREALHYAPLILRNPLSAGPKALVQYHRLVNPKLDFLVRLGRVHLLFYNTGSDAFIGGEHSLVDILGGNPDTRGLLDVQLAWLRTYLEVVPEGHLVFVVTHAPPINFPGDHDLRDLLASARIAAGKSPHVDDLRDDVGTISKHRHEFLRLATSKGVTAVVSGHVHRPGEYRVEFGGGTGGDDDASVRRVYCSNYSERLASCSSDEEVDAFWEANRPLFLCSSALGPSNHHVREGRLPAYRKFVVRGGRVVDARSFPLRREPFVYLGAGGSKIELRVPWKKITRGKNFQGFSGEFRVELENADSVSAVKGLLEVEVRFRGRGLSKHELSVEVGPASAVPGRKPKITRPSEALLPKGAALEWRVEDALALEGRFAGEVHYGRGLLSALTGVEVRVSFLAALKVGSGWRVVGDEDWARRYGLSY
ncbi:MAG: hypothetical protein Kow0069_31750 [Promethearchaeota archaeon]